MPVGWRQEGAASGRRLHGRVGCSPMSADTSVPKHQEAMGLDDFESWLPDAMLRDAPAGVAFLGPDMRFGWVNAALARLYGHDQAEFAGRPMAEVWPAKDPSTAEAALRPGTAEGRGVAGEGHLQGGGGAAPGARRGPAGHRGVRGPLVEPRLSLVPRARA